MFTGIIQALGQVRQATPVEGGMRLVIDAARLDLDDVSIGDSIAVNGVCLTVTALDATAFSVDVSQETLRCTVGFELGAALNLEKALRLSDRLGGHLVSGHVDGIGEVVRSEPLGENRTLAVRIPAELGRYVVRKGSITVNGVSLTVNEVGADEFAVNLIPHTLAETNLSVLGQGSRVNLEIDLIARYIARLLEMQSGCHQGAAPP